MKLLHEFLLEVDSGFCLNIAAVDNFFDTFFQTLERLPKANFAVGIFIFDLAELKLSLGKLSYRDLLIIIQMKHPVDIPYDFEAKRVMILFGYFDGVLYLFLKGQYFANLGLFIVEIDRICLFAN